MKWLDRLRRRRTDPKVFGVGLNKTGTTTLGACFEILGYTHRSYDLDLLRAAVAGDLAPVFEVADRYDAFEDWPWPLVFEALDERYPDARFILTMRRDAAIWLDSLTHHAEQTPDSPARMLVYGHQTPRGEEAAHLAHYEAHAARVRAQFASRPEKLLTVCWEHGDGWREICSFLDRAIPDQPFPHERRGETRRSNR